MNVGPTRSKDVGGNDRRSHRNGNIDSLTSIS